MCAAALAATGHLTSVRFLSLALELPSSEDMISLAKIVSEGVKMTNVFGDVGPLLSSLTCSGLVIHNMKLDQAATCSGVSNRVVLDEVTGDIGPFLSNLKCTQLHLSNMKLDQAATSSLVRALQHGVERLWLGTRGLVRLHIQTLV